MSGYTIDTKLLKVWKNGGKWDIWANHLDMVKNFIDESKLEPLDQVTSANYLLEKSVEMPTISNMKEFDDISELKKVKKYLKRVRGIKGGIRVPHLHFRGDIYMLNDEQWHAFSGMMLDNFKQKFERANTIGFEPMMDLAQTIDSKMV